MYKDEEIEKFLENLDIVQVIGEYVTLKKTGANYKGFSPFKEERTPSFVVSPTKNIFKDFSTGIGGNAISFYMKINNITFYEAVEELSEKYNVPIKKLNISKKNSLQNEKYYEIMREAQRIFSENILKSEQALKYMENRGFSLEEIKKYGIGFSLDTWDSLLNALKEKGMMLDSSVKNILENKVVLITPKSAAALDSFEALAGDSIKKIGVGEPKSVPVGQYTEQVFQNLGLTDKVASKLILAKDVREVLSWVETGNVDAGVVYETDAKISKDVTICSTAPEGSHKKVIYPIGVVKASKHAAEAQKFVDFLFSDAAKEVFARYGFTVISK